MGSAAGRARRGARGTSACRPSIAWLGLAVACAHPAATAGVTPAVSECLVAADSSAPRIDTVSIAAAGPQLAAAPASAWPFAANLIAAHLAPAAAFSDCEEQPGGGPVDVGPPFGVRTHDAAAIVLGPHDSLAPLRLRFVPLRADRDERDALDGAEGPSAPRIDLLVTRSPRTIAYAAGRAELVVRPLAWDLTYVLAGAGTSPPGTDVRAALARDAVRADARGAEPPFWWLGNPSCAGAGSAGPAPAGDAVIAYADDDPIARDLTARIVALAAIDRSARWLGRLAGHAARAMPVPRARLDSVLQRGEAWAIISGWPRAARPACAGLPGRDAAGHAPLVDTRPHLIVRRGVPSLVIGADGTFRVLPGSRR